MKQNTFSCTYRKGKFDSNDKSKLPRHVWYEVFEFIEPKVYTYPKWLEEESEYSDKQDCFYDDIAHNPKAIRLLEKKEPICNFLFADNPAAIRLIKENIDNEEDLSTFVSYLSRNTNPEAIPILNKYLKYVDWKNLSINHNPAAIPVLERNLDKIDWRGLSTNPAAIPILEKNLDKVDWRGLSRNPSAIPILEKNLDKVDWWGLSRNPAAIPLLERNLDKVDWRGLSRNPSAIPILEKNLDKVDWKGLYQNPAAVNWDAVANYPDADRILEKNMIDLEEDEVIGKLCKSSNINVIRFLDKILEKGGFMSRMKNEGGLMVRNFKILLLLDWEELSANPAAIHIIEKHINDKYSQVCWEGLSRNPAAIHILEQNLDKVVWRELTCNPAAINLLEKNLDKLKCWDDWQGLSLNPNPAAMDILGKNLDKVSWRILHRNPGLFTVDENESKILVKEKVDKFLETMS